MRITKIMTVIEFHLRINKKKLKSLDGIRETGKSFQSKNFTLESRKSLKSYNSIRKS